MPSRQAEPLVAARATPSAPVTERRRIVVSKLAAPPLRSGVVDRPALLDFLTSTTDSPVVLVSAPAGYGKTMLLALWNEHDERPFAWISLDAADNDPVALVASVLAALDPILELDGTIRDSLGFPEPPLEEFVLPSLIDACAESGQRFVLVLDDLYLVTEKRCHTVIGYLSERLPQGCQLALATRADPPLPLGSLRAHGQLAELRAPELALRDDEARAMFAAAGVSLTEDLVAQLVERTEGWPAALYLAALSLRDRSDPEDFVDRFTGTTRHVADFLSDDVLARQPEAVIRFLRHTCVLEELTVALCDAVTGGTDADRELQVLERSNLFVVPLDEERQTYRYHKLFAQYLRAELAHRETDLLPELHRRASRWYSEHGFVGRAIAHAQAAGDVDVAAGLVAGEWAAVAQAGQIATVRSWLSSFTDSQIEGHAPLAIAATWIAGLAGEGERAARFAEAAGRGSWDGPMPDGSASLESALAIMPHFPGLSGIRAAAERAVELEAVTSPWRPVALQRLGVAEALTGRFPEARAALAEAVELSGGENSTAAISLAYLALTRLHEGDEEEAFHLAQRAHAIADQPGMRTFMPSIATFSVLAYLLSRRGDLDETARAVDRATELLPKVSTVSWWQWIEARILLAPALEWLGRGDEAMALLDEAAALLAVHPDAGMLPEWHDETARTLRLARRRPHRSQELSDAERRILRLLATDLTLREIGRELYLSMNTVKTHTRSIYRKLGVSSRAEAVKAARTALSVIPVGLLGADDMVDSQLAQSIAQIADIVARLVCSGAG